MATQSILVVDDDVQFGRLVKRVLSGMGHDVEHISNPYEIFKRYNNHVPDIVFLDIFMPGFDGIDAAKWLIDKGFNGKLVFMTGHNSTFLDAACAVARHSEADIATLVKPVRVNEICDLVNEQRD